MADEPKSERYTVGLSKAEELFGLPVKEPLPQEVNGARYRIFRKVLEKSPSRGVNVQAGVRVDGEVDTGFDADMWLRSDAQSGQAPVIVIKEKLGYPMNRRVGTDEIQNSVEDIEVTYILSEDGKILFDRKKLKEQIPDGQRYCSSFGDSLRAATIRREVMADVPRGLNVYFTPSDLKKAESVDDFTHAKKDATPHGFIIITNLPLQWVTP